MGRGCRLGTCAAIVTLISHNGGILSLMYRITLKVACIVLQANAYPVFIGSRSNIEIISTVVGSKLVVSLSPQSMAGY